MRIELHSHTLLSDGELIPIELARRAVVKGHKALAVTDHASLSNLDRLISEAGRDVELAAEWGLDLIVGVEITHVPARRIGQVVKEARKRGAELIVIHGETVNEPVEKDTNHEAVSNPEVDILAHPGFITLEEAELAKRNDVVLEITSRRSHNPTNGHVAKMALEAGARMVVNTDAHDPSDLITDVEALMVARAAGLPEREARMAVYDVPQELVRRARGR
ncbi:MAG TPA: histidinol phosphate phosphatase domain-containing protein [Methanomassiliicoccales archaeon]|nr:histidinol phosphate phosphatase domain-containing protein [Methanomassiliicoccales archaeon]